MPEDTALTEVVRTLLAAGFEITDVDRHPTYAEISCGRVSGLGPTLRFLLGVTTEEIFTPEQRQALERSASAEGRAMVLIGPHSSEGQLGLADFLDFFGGAVPSWQDFNASYDTSLRQAALNVVPEGMKGEAWLIFEDLVCAGLGFIFGRKANRLGGRTRGRRVSDILAQIPGRKIVVVDAKASAPGFDANWPALRALVEYVDRQKVRQRAYNDVYSALIVSSSFQQTTAQLEALNHEFLAATQVPLGFLTADLLATMVRRIQESVDIRAAVNWRTIIAGGLVRVDVFERELRNANDERYDLERGT